MRVPLFQITDSMFPIGSLSQSFGLETLASQGTVTKDGLGEYMQALLWNQVGPCDLVFMLATYDDIENVETLSKLYGCHKLVPEFHAASLKMGKRMMQLGARLTGDARLKRLEGKPVHHAAAFGAVAQAAGASREEAAQAFLYNWSASVVSASIRLFPIGHDAAQELLYTMGKTIDAVYEAHAKMKAEEAWQFSPQTEIAGLDHGKLHTKLFLS